MDAEMLEIVKCSCGSKEYYGMMHWFSGKQLCRKCMYELWEQQSNWRRDYATDFVFPLYENGKDYTKVTLDMGEVL